MDCLVIVFTCLTIDYVVPNRGFVHCEQGRQERGGTTPLWLHGYGNVNIEPKTGQIGVKRDRTIRSIR